MSFLTSILSKTPTSRLLNQISQHYVKTIAQSDTFNRILYPINTLIQQTAGFKTKGHLRRRCKDCYFVRRQERLFVICNTHRRHKQMQMVKDERNTWILTHATQGKVRPW